MSEETSAVAWSRLNLRSAATLKQPEHGNLYRRDIIVGSCIFYIYSEASVVIYIYRTTTSARGVLLRACFST